MSSLFGSRKDSPPDGGGDGAALDAEIDRLCTLPLAQLAAEVMIRAFGPGTPGGPGQPGTLESPSADRLILGTIARQFTPALAGHGVTAGQQQRLTGLVAEGLQLLQNAALVRVTWHGGTENYLATRRGRVAVTEGAVERLVSTTLA